MFARSIRVASLVFVLALIAIGCHTVPLGDPEKSVSDAKLAGFWMSQKADKSGMLVHITVYDKHTYVITAYGFSENGDVVKADGKYVTKAWETKVADMDVMTFEIIDPDFQASAGKEAAAKYSYYRIRKLDGSIEMTALNTDFLKDTKTPQELEKKIADNVNNPELFKGSDSMIFKSAAERMDEVKKILKAFEPPK